MRKTFLLFLAVLIALLMPLSLGADLGNLDEPLTASWVTDDAGLMLLNEKEVLLPFGSTTAQVASAGYFLCDIDTTDMQYYWCDASVHNGQAVSGPGVGTYPA